MLFRKKKLVFLHSVFTTMNMEIEQHTSLGLFFRVFGDRYCTSHWFYHWKWVVASLLLLLCSLRLSRCSRWSCLLFYLYPCVHLPSLFLYSTSHLLSLFFLVPFPVHIVLLDWDHNCRPIHLVGNIQFRLSWPIK